MSSHFISEYCAKRVYLSAYTFVLHVLTVCPHVGLGNHTSKLHQVFSACYLLPWLRQNGRILKVTHQGAALERLRLRL